MDDFGLKITVNEIFLKFYNKETDSVEVIKTYPTTAENISKLVDVVYILNNEIF